MTKEYCIAHHHAELCFLPNCRLHFFLLGNVEELLEKLNPMCFTHQHVDCLHTQFKYRFSGNFVFKIGQVIDDDQRVVKVFQKTEQGTEWPA